MAIQFGFERAVRLGPHGVRRGAAGAILEAGGCLAQLLGAGQWHSSACRLYLGLGVEETEAMASISIEASDDEGPGRRERDGEVISQSPRPLGSESLT